MNTYEERLEARRERLEAAAAKAQERSDAAYQGAHRILNGIPMGQPILVGHHSERHHRRDLARADSAMSRSVAESKRASELARRADAVGSAGISSDDPDAVTKLQEKLAGLEAEQKTAKALNAYWRKHGTMKGAPGVSDESAARLDAEIPTRYTWERVPVPSYRLKNQGAEIRRVKARILQLAAPKVSRPTEQYGDVSIVQIPDANRVAVCFPSKPAPPVIAALKARGFHWNRSQMAWTRMDSDAAWYAAQQIAKEATL